MILVYENVPVIRAAKAREIANREAAFKGLRHSIGGITVRQMTVRDFLILDARKSPFVIPSRVPALPDLAEFIWTLSPEIERWHDEEGWRKPWIMPGIERLQAFRCGRRVRKIYSDEATRQCFEFVDVMFQDSPAGKGGGEQYISYLAGWCDTMRSEYKCTESEVFKMPLPKLFSYLRAMELRKNPEPRLVNRSSSEVRRIIVAGINAKKWTPDEVMSPDFALN